MITQTEADNLIALNKKKMNDNKFTFPHGGNLLTIPIVSLDGREKFLIDINRGRIRLSKCTYQERFQSTIILVRLDIDGPPHQNPDVNPAPLPYLRPYIDASLPCPHLHLYVENYMDKWAIPAPSNKFTDTKDLFHTLVEFFAFCNITDVPNIEEDLFT